MKLKKHEDLVKMGVKELNQYVAELVGESKTAEGDELAAIVATVEDAKAIIEDAKTRAKLAGMAAAAEPDNGGGDEGKQGESSEQGGRVKAFADRAEAIKAGKEVKFSAGTISTRVKGALSVSQTAPVTHTAADVKPTFNDVSSLIDRVKAVPLNGGETYERGFVKDYGDGAGVTAEGKDYNTTEPVFGYVTIEKQKITAYTEEPEEMVKLPSADYDGVVEESVTRAVRRNITRQILIGDGSTNRIKGIFFNPKDKKEDVIDRDTDIELSRIDDGTLDEIIYTYGGDEDVEAIATLILNKADLKAFAKLRDKQGRKVYTIVNNGNTGTIDGVPFIINSACAAVSAEATENAPYAMAYGVLDNYELAIFSDIDSRKSTDYKFKSGQIAFRASVFIGGAVVAHNGFIRVKRAAKADA
ncbi:MAG: phage major capsid protein [Lachnospiraceae bacterium]|nr:phage major capsid protein [Lachnospiraceae bacterium]